MNYVIRWNRKTTEFLSLIIATAFLGGGTLVGNVLPAIADTTSPETIAEQVVTDSDLNPNLDPNLLMGDILDAIADELKGETTEAEADQTLQSLDDQLNELLNPIAPTAEEDSDAQ